MWQYLQASLNEREEDLCLINPNRSSCWWASSGRGRGARLCLTAVTPAWQVTLAVSSDKKELNEHPLNDSCPSVESLGRREETIHAWWSCAMPFIAVLSPCAGSASSQIPCWAAYTWRVLKVMTFSPLFFSYLFFFFTSYFSFIPVFFLCLFFLCSLLFFYLSHNIFFSFGGFMYLSLYSNISIGNTGSL